MLFCLRETPGPVTATGLLRRTISLANWTLPRDGYDIKQTMNSAPAFEIGPFDNMALAVPVWPGCHRQQFRSQVGLKNLGDSRCRQLRKLNKEAPADV